MIDAEKTPKVATSPVESPLAPPEVLIMGAPKIPVATEVDKNADEVEFTKKDLEVIILIFTRESEGLETWKFKYKYIIF